MPEMALYIGKGGGGILHIITHKLRNCLCTFVCNTELNSQLAKITKEKAELELQVNELIGKL